MKAIIIGLVVLAAACGGDSSQGGVDASGDALPAGACGGRTNLQCSANQYCDFNRNSCGISDETGTCTARPGVCPLMLVAEPTCGCDGKVYSSECDAQTSGVDLDSSGRCVLPTGSFACGYRQCMLASDYCERTTGKAGEADTFACKPLPICAGTPTCACLTTVKCGSMCTGTAIAGLTVTCPG